MCAVVQMRGCVMTWSHRERSQWCSLHRGTSLRKYQRALTGHCCLQACWPGCEKVRGEEWEVPLREPLSQHGWEPAPPASLRCSAMDPRGGRADSITAHDRRGPRRGGAGERAGPVRWGRDPTLRGRGRGQGRGQERGRDPILAAAARGGAEAGGRTGSGPRRGSRDGSEGRAREVKGGLGSRGATAAGRSRMKNAADAQSGRGEHAAGGGEKAGGRGGGSMRLR